MHWSNFGVRRATLKPELEHGKSKTGHKDGSTKSPTNDVNDWGRHCGSQNVEFPWLQNSACSAARKLVTLLLLAFRSVPETKPDVVRFAGQSSALQLPKRASCWTRLK